MMGVGVVGCWVLWCQVRCCVCNYGLDGMGGTEQVGLANARDQF